ncbi:MAG TPA: hypothetical protein VFK52_02810 [Nocardioidaceae bacterium]|nr:hypothetical protein [Nocardioidaceae bacterium]
MTEVAERADSHVRWVVLAVTIVPTLSVVDRASGEELEVRPPRN